MTQKEQYALACELAALSVFRGIRNREPVRALEAFLGCSGDPLEKMERYGAFVHSLGAYGYDFSGFLCRAVYEDENPWILAAAGKGKAFGILEANARAELRLLSRLTKLRPEILWENSDYQGYIPAFENRELDMEEAYDQRRKEIGRYGYGVFASANMFRVENGDIVPVPAADLVTMDRFVGYETERQKVFDNTRALLEGKPAANMLLFGDAGTGKSSTVKACANYYADQGLRLIELRKDQLFALPMVMGRIAGNPLKFIIFIDDLSFNKNDDSFSMLKAALEGSASAKASNAVICATSNRRHIVKENFSDREGSDDVHHGDTMQELLSLSDRFGLTVYFMKPNKQLYLQIVHALARKKGLEMDEKLLDMQAEAFALRKGSRSPRAAEQFVNSLL